jgi:uncharacterized protein (DUF3820 family)
MIPYTDNTVMPFGKYKGKTLANVPASYLLYIYDEGFMIPPGLRQYINENMRLLDSEARREKGYGKR